MSFISKSIFSSTLLVTVWLAGCQGLPVKSGDDREPQVAADEDPLLPFAEPPVVTGELSEDMVFSTLLGEIASQRGQFDIAYNHELLISRIAGNAEAAERATRLAIHQRDDERARKAVARWVELAPNELSARQLAVMLNARSGEDKAVMAQMEAILAISHAQGEDGFLNVLAALNKDPEKQRAIGLMQQLVSAHSGDPEGHYALALMAALIKEYGLAERETLTLLDDHPEWYKGYVLLSRIYVGQGQKPKGRKVLADAIAQYPNETEIRGAYARLLIEVGSLEMAYQQFSILVEVDGSSADNFFSLGVLALQLERYDEARGWFNHLLEMRARRDDAIYYLGRLAEIEEDTKTAIEYYQRVRGESYRYEALVRMAYLRAETGELEEARDQLRAMRIQEPDRSVQLYLTEIEILRSQGQGDQIMPLYEAAFRAHPENEDLLYSRALYAATISRVDILEQDLKLLLSENPEHADALNALGYTLADQTDRYQEALGYIEKALKLKPDAPAILDSMGWVQYRLGNMEQALKYLRQALEKLPDHEISAHLGEVLWVTGAHEQARKIWRAALEQAPESKQLLDAMKRFGQ
ncbi:MAG: tetratricopeptide repeat protein [Gammaproteobacteria bacterium]|nr:tetratricopeptide repeat protein [Gammaproteobacteria bacterium]